MTRQHAAIKSALAGLVIGSAATEFSRAVGNTLNGLVVAEPGAGKTTGVPLALLNESWLENKADHGIILVEPRRVAARQAAERMATLLGENVSTRTNGVVGLRMRDETRVGSKTRIEVVTDGVLPRMLMADPGLSGRSVIIFDEFHERSLDADLGLALTLSARELLRPDLVVIVMSATLEGDRVAQLLTDHGGNGLERLQSPGRAFPVTTTLRPGSGDLAQRVTDAVVESISARTGDVLVFLPGIFEINRCYRALTNHHSLREVTLLPLHARGNLQDTEDALRPHRPGEQRVVLSTSLAQTSVTIDGVTTVIDSGLVRRPVRDPDTGMSRLDTARISAATAIQRAGRAGRTAPGQAVQLWSAAEATNFAPNDVPEITQADLASPMLTALVWGVNPGELAWVDPPSIGMWHRAGQHLEMLGAVDDQMALTRQGRAMSTLGTQPRIAALLCNNSDVTSHGDDIVAAAALAAYLSESSWFGVRAPIDLRQRIETLCGHEPGDLVDRATQRKFMRAWDEFLQGASHGAPDTGRLGALALRAFPERLAHLTSNAGHRYTFANGLTLPLATGDIASLRGAPLIVAIDVESDRRNGMIRVAVPIAPTDVRKWAAQQATEGASHFFRVESRRSCDWVGERLEARQEDVVMSEIGEVPIGVDLVPITVQEVADAVELRLSAEPSMVAINPSGNELLARIRLAEASETQSPLVPAIKVWLVDTLDKPSASFSMNSIDVSAALRHWLSITGQARTIDQRFPSNITVGGRQHSVRYDTDSGRPTVSIRVQDLFGTTQSPSVDGGRERITLELVSPANRVVAVTDDLQRFWNVGYPSVRTELRGRYPKHQWPEDPTQAEARRMNQPKR
jgi:ATP-dependent helicase HrpB